MGRLGTLSARARSVGIAFVLVGLFVSATAAPAAAENVCVQQLPLRVSAVTGWAWIGTVRDVEHQQVQGGTRTVVTFDVEKVLARGDDDARIRVGADLVLQSGPCDRLTGFRSGHDYLVSTHVIDRPRSDTTAAWLLDGTIASFLVMHSDQRYDPRLGKATTLDQAAVLVAPGGELPPTSVASAPIAADGDVNPRVALYLAVMAAGLCAGLFLTHRRRNLARLDVRGREVT